MVWNQIKITKNLKSVFVRLRSQLFAAYNSGHTATLRYAQIWQSRTSYVRRTSCTILKGEVNVWQIGKIGG